MLVKPWLRGTRYVLMTVAKANLEIAGYAPRVGPAHGSGKLLVAAQTGSSRLLGFCHDAWLLGQLLGCSGGAGLVEKIAEARSSGRHHEACG